jgi:ankyrin repeat protein
MNKDVSKATTNGTTKAIDFSDIYFLAKEDMYSDLEFLLRKTPEIVNIPNEDGVSALHFAAGWNRIKSVMVLVENGADIKIRDKRLSTPLGYAAMRGHGIVVDFLLEQSGCYKLINSLNSLGMTLLHDVCYVGQHNIALKLISSGGDIRIKDNVRNIIYIYYFF